MDGRLTAGEMTELMGWISTSGIDGMEEFSSYPGLQTSDGRLLSSDMMYKVVINFANGQITRSAAEYRCENGVCPDMPDPLGELYGRLYTIAQGTSPVYVQDMKR